jgi:hypothetical protein
VVPDSMSYSAGRELVDDTLDAYIEWREKCAAVRDAYRRWAIAPVSRETGAFLEYVATLDNEEHAANLYAQLIRGIRRRASFRPRNPGNARRWRSPRA